MERLLADREALCVRKFGCALDGPISGRQLLAVTCHAVEEFAELDAHNCHAVEKFADVTHTTHDLASWLQFLISPQRCPATGILPSLIGHISHLTTHFPIR
ncbi:MAG: hypothetical protein AB7D27_09280 [Desulfomicrobium sp.]